LPNLTIYEASSPVNFYLENDFTLTYGKWKGYIDTFCTNCVSQCTDSKWSPIIVYIFQYYDNLIYSTSHNVVGTRKSNLFEDGDHNAWKFQRADKRHVYQLFTSTQELGKIQSQIGEIPKFIVKQNLTFHTVGKDNWESVGCELNEFSAEILRMLTVLDSYINMLSMCSSRFLDVNIISPRQLKTSLEQLRDLVSRFNVTLSISISDIMSYYGLPIVDCLISKDIIVLSVNIPLVSKHIEIVKKRTVIIPYQWDKYVCYLEMPINYLAILTLPDGKTKILTLHCNPYKDYLCYATDIVYDLTAHVSCLISVITGTFADTQAEACSMTCTESTVTRVTQLQYDTFVITNAPAVMKYQCKAEVDVLIQHNNIGALKVQMPCNCKLKVTDDVIISPQFPCLLNDTNTVNFLYYLPPAWCKVPSVSIKKYSTTSNFNSFKDTFNMDSNPINTRDHIIVNIGLIYAIVGVIIVAFVIVVIKLYLRIRTTEIRQHRWEQNNQLRQEQQSSRQDEGRVQLPTQADVPQRNQQTRTFNVAYRRSTQELQPVPRPQLPPSVRPQVPALPVPITITGGFIRKTPTATIQRRPAPHCPLRQQYSPLHRMNQQGAVMTTTRDGVSAGQYEPVKSAHQRTEMQQLQQNTSAKYISVIPSTNNTNSTIYEVVP
jgi:type II secretory pathway pseudopilin PulG